VISKFSTATKQIDKAIIGSTRSGGATMMFFILKARVIVCAMVKALACQMMVDIFVLNKQSEMTNRI
jgi:hypothetical protein